MTHETKQKSSPFILAIMGIVLVFGIGLRIKRVIDDRKPIVATVVVAGRTFEAEVADTPGKKELGLGKRDSLADGKGMYFPFPAPQYWVFWMKDMRFPIDIIWIRDGKVVDVSRDALAPVGDASPATFSPSEPADAVLEVKVGAAAGIKAGDAVSLDVTGR